MISYKKVNQIGSFDEARERATLILVIGNALLSLFVITHFLWFCNLTIKLAISALPHISQADSIAELKHTPLLLKLSDKLKSRHKLINGNISISTSSNKIS